MAFDLETLLLLEAIILLAAFIQGAVGFAFGMTSMGLAVFLIDARVASIIVSPLAAANVALALWSVRHAIHLRNVVPMVVGMVIGLPFGLLILLEGSTSIIRISVAVLLVYVGTSRLLSNGHTRRPLHPWWGYVAGLFAGVVGGATNIGGPPLIAYVAHQPWKPVVFKASLLTCFLVSSGLKTITLGIEGSLDARLLTSVAVLLPAVVVGSQIGIVFFNRVNQRLFGHLVSVLIVVLGILLFF